MMWIELNLVSKALDAKAAKANGQSVSTINRAFGLNGTTEKQAMLKLSTTTKSGNSNLLPIPTPCEILLEDFLKS